MEDDAAPEMDRSAEVDASSSPADADPPREEVISSTEPLDLPAEPVEVVTEDSVGAQQEAVEPINEVETVSAAIVEETVHMEVATSEPMETLDETPQTSPDDLPLKQAQSSKSEVPDNPESPSGVTPELPNESEEGTSLETTNDLEFRKGSIPEPAREATPEPAEEETPEPAEKESPEPAQEETPEPAQDETPEPAQGETQEPSEGETPEPVIEETPEPTEDISPETYKKSVLAHSKDSTPDLSSLEKHTKVNTPTPLQTAPPSTSKSPPTVPSNRKPLETFTQPQPPIVVPKQNKQKSCCLVM